MQGARNLSDMNPGFQVVVLCRVSCGHKQLARHKLDLQDSPPLDLVCEGDYMPPRPLTRGLEVSSSGGSFCLFQLRGLSVPAESKVWRCPARTTWTAGFEHVNYEFSFLSRSPIFVVFSSRNVLKFPVAFDPLGWPLMRVLGLIRPETSFTCMTRSSKSLPRFGGRRCRGAAQIMQCSHGWSLTPAHRSFEGEVLRDSESPSKS